MTTSVGKNTIQGKRLLEIIEHSEAYDASKKEISELDSALMAAARAEGFNTKAIKWLKKRRKMKPHDRQEADEICDAYAHAVGMDEEPPLFRAMSAMAGDSLGRENLLNHMLDLVPVDGDIILRIGGEPVRIFRDHAGNAKSEPYQEKPAKAAAPSKPAASPMPAGRQREIPNVDEGGAFGYGQQMFRDNRPIIENPFPFGDPRRARCDEGYRHESGSDGMGSDD